MEGLVTEIFLIAVLIFLNGYFAGVIKPALQEAPIKAISFASGPIALERISPAIKENVRMVETKDRPK